MYTPVCQASSPIKEMCPGNNSYTIPPQHPTPPTISQEDTSSSMNSFVQRQRPWPSIGKIPHKWIPMPHLWSRVIMVFLISLLLVSVSCGNSLAFQFHHRGLVAPHFTLGAPRPIGHQWWLLIPVSWVACPALWISPQLWRSLISGNDVCMQVSNLTDC